MAKNDRASTLSGQAYEGLRRDILNGYWDPGARLPVRRISEHYGVGASPIREALARLVGEGLVLAVGQRGFRVPPLDLTDLSDVTSTRVLIESEALRQSIELGDDSWESRVVATYHALEKLESDRSQHLHEWEERNRQFHEALVSACPSRWLHQMCQILHDQHRRYRFISNRHATGRDVATEHRALRDAAISGDVNKATSILKLHIERTATTVARLLTEGDPHISENSRGDREKTVVPGVSDLADHR